MLADPSKVHHGALDHAGALRQDPRVSTDAALAACGCEPDVDAQRFSRQCDDCGTWSVSRHCPHASRQDPCPECDVCPVTQLA